MRLPVILVQNAPAGEAAYAESLVGNLIGRPGLDLTLVDRFDSIAVDSTDRMTLEGISVPSAVLDWQKPERMLSALAEIGVQGTRSPHQLDRDVAASHGTSPRRLFLFDLTTHRHVEAILAELDRIRASLSVKTFSLAGLSAVASSRENTPIADPSQESENATPTPIATASPVIAKPQTSPTPSPGTVRSDENLDDLIDQLDDLDV